MRAGGEGGCGRAGGRGGAGGSARWAGHPDHRAPPRRRNGKVGLSGMAIADITLLSGFHALRADLEKVGRALGSPAPSLQPCRWPPPGDPLLLCS